jgi:hypothetical protein
VRFNFIRNFSGDLLYNEKGAHGHPDIWVVGCEPKSGTATKCTLNWTYPAFLVLTFDAKAVLQSACVAKHLAVSDRPILRINDGEIFVGSKQGCFKGNALSRISRLAIGDRVRIRSYYVDSEKIVDTDSVVTVAYFTAIDMQRFIMSSEYKAIPWYWWSSVLALWA